MPPTLPAVDDDPNKTASHASEPDPAERTHLGISRTCALLPGNLSPDEDEDDADKQESPRV